MKLRFLVKSTEKIVHDNAPTILAGVAVVGTAATAYLTGRATWRAKDKVNEAWKKGLDSQAPDAKWQVVKLTWSLYLPPAVAGITTIACIICSTRMNTQRAVALAAAYSLSEKKLSEYKSKIEEKLGIEKKEEIDQEILKEQVKNTPVPTLVTLGGDDVLCFDSYSGRYFKSNENQIRQAANNTNFEVINNRFATLEFFWNELGTPDLAPTAYSDEFGWTASCTLHIRFNTMISGDGKPALVVDYDVEPVRGWDPVFNS